ncbi:uncharacterized protein LOC121980402 isoform X2 [Zingiber officinale]|uniref:uncharacterized protein LOC121980402 isoform X2 n=1 Tax=Zingiber officinale TaxID=94328 RepID=UPI001C4A7D1F|nr:uncharacterized protein LOC121980402 isoform X2 [Zingiber officinale]XP_042388357.1 uncharacterized protein LOC121980402 isoform X2 [Zingiber officinale]
MASPADSTAALLRSAVGPPLHATDADEDDESVKQLKECAVLYLSLQECLAETNRDWKSCQPCPASLLAHIHPLVRVATT